MDRLSVLSGGITGSRKGTRLAWEPRRRKKGVEYATGERDAFPTAMNEAASRLTISDT
jgi:hypothetical protein